MWSTKLTQGKYRGEPGHTRTCTGTSVDQCGPVLTVWTSGLGEHRSNPFLRSSSGKVRGPRYLRPPRVADGGVTATGVLSRQRGNLITVVITHY